MKLKNLGIGLGFIAAASFGATAFAQSNDGGDGGDGGGMEEEDHNDGPDEEPPLCEDASDCMEGDVCVYPEDLGFEEGHDFDDGEGQHDEGNGGDAGSNDGGDDQAIDGHGEEPQGEFGEYGYCVPGCEVDEDCRDHELCHVTAGACVPKDVIDELEEEGAYDHDEALEEREKGLDDAAGLLGGCGGASAVPPSILMLFGSLGTLWVRRRFR